MPTLHLPMYHVPIYHLPNELIRAILFFAASEDDEPLPYCLGSRIRVAASEVCHKWRDICLHTGEFWTFIDFLDGPPFSRTRLHIQRA
jgi:hypothetical protein